MKTARVCGNTLPTLTTLVKAPRPTYPQVMASDEEVLLIAATAFAQSNDFNGMTASSLARGTGTSWEELKPQLARLTAGGQMNLVFASHSTNPHIKRLPDLPSRRAAPAP